MADLIDLDPNDGIPARGITPDTCAKMGYGWGWAQGSDVHVANLYDGGVVVAQKLRFPDKRFSWTGDTKTNALFGAHRAGRGKMIVVTEGELDALSVAQVQNCKWPVVSVTKGASGAAAQLAANLEMLSAYERIVLMFDSDEPGQAAASACAQVLPPGTAYIATLPLKDANAMLTEGRGHELPDLAWKAQPWRPDGVVSGLDLIDDVVAIPEPGLPYPWGFMSRRLYGQRLGEIVMWTAGTGIGKTTIVQQNAYNLAMREGRRVGYIGLEETATSAARRLVSIHMGRLLHVPDVRAGIPEAEVRAAAAEVLKNFEFYNHEGSFDWDSLEAKIRYWKHAAGIEWVVVDHISFVLASTATKAHGNDQTDELMTRLRLLAENLHIHLDVICHVRKTGSGATAFEEGGAIALDDLRGSGTLKTVPNVILAVERNQQADEGDDARDVAVVRGLKDRFTGEALGPLGRLRYDTATGRHDEVDETAEAMAAANAAQGSTAATDGGQRRSRF